LSELIKEIVELNETKVNELVSQKLENNENPTKIMDEVKVAMKEIGDKFEKKEYFLPELIMSGEILRQIFEIHVVKFMLDVNGFEVLDLGVDVSAEKFIQSLKEFKPKVLALSGFLSLAYDSMKEIIQKLEDIGLRNSVKIMIGGGTVDERIVEFVGADAYGQSAVDAVNLATNWMGV